MISAYVARHRRSLEALPGGPYPGADPAEAAVLKEALGTLEKGEPFAGDDGNGLYGYLRAVAAMRSGNPFLAVEEVRKGNAAPKIEITVAQNPIATVCPALGHLHELAKYADAMIGADPTVAGDLYVTALRIARAEPRSLINLLVGSAFVNVVLKTDAVAARASNDPVRIRDATRGADLHRDWMTSVMKTVMMGRLFSPINQVRFCRLAGIDAFEFAKYFDGTLEDPAKVAAFETAADLTYRRERVKVERMLRRLPNG